MMRTERQIDLTQIKSSSVQSKEIRSYIFVLSLITNLVPNCYSVSLLISRFLSLLASLPFYTLFPFHFYPPCAGQMAGVDTCPISTSLKFSCSSYKAEIHYSGITSTLMWPEGQLQSIYYSGSSFLFRYFRTPSYPMRSPCLSVSIESS